MATTSTQQTTAQIGGVPTVELDIPICSVFLALFVALAAGHMTILQLNNKRKHKFLFNGLCFGFAMSRIMACMFRLIWATKPTNSDISLVAAVFLNAGILIIYIVNNLFAWRLIRSVTPKIGWHPIARITNKILLWFVAGLIIPLIVIIILRVKNPTLPGVAEGSSVVGKLAQTYFLVIAVEPAFLLLFAIIARRKSGQILDPFGKHSWDSKVIVLSLTIPLAIIEAGFRAGTTWTTAPLASDPAWWDSKAAFYCFNFTIDVLVLTIFLVGRIDQRFHVPDGASKRANYSLDHLSTENKEKHEMENGTGYSREGEESGIQQVDETHGI